MNTHETFRQAAEARKRKKEEKKNPKSPNVHNMTMGEALRWEMEKNPTLPIVQKINNDNQRQAAERIRLEEERRFFQLRGHFKDVGLMWFGARIDPAISKLLEHNHIRIPIEQKQEQWMHALTTLKNRPSKQRIELLRALASGMRLSEDNTTPADDASYRKIFRFVPFVYSGDNLTFTRPSAFFMEGISDMWGHSKEQKQEFTHFMVKRSGLTGKVGLPQLFPGISRWIDQSASLPPQSVKPT